MKSGNPDVYRPPGGRTERDVAAEVIVRLLEAGELHRTAAAVARACAAVGVPVPLVRKVWATRTISTTSKLDGTLIATGDELPPMAPKIVHPETAPEQAEPPEVDEPETSSAEVVQPQREPWKERNAERVRKANAARVAKKNPKPGKRVCSRCKETKPVEDFALKDKRRKTLRSMCKPCFSSYQHDRYLSSAKLEKLGPVLRFILEEGDEHCGFVCPDCRQPCRIGDEVIATDAVLHHASHHEVGEA
jgi:hypothetical protein